MNKLLAIIYFGILSCCSCNKEIPFPTIIEQGVVISKPFIWWNKEEEHDATVETYGLIYKSCFLAESHKDRISYLSLQKGDDGKILWRWSDYSSIYDNSILDYYSYNSYFFFQQGPRSYCINLETGKTQWKKTWNKPHFVRPSGYNDKVFVLQDYPDNGATHPGFYILNLEDGDIIEKIIPHFENFTNRNVSDEFGRITDVNSIEKNGKVFLLITYCEAINDKHCFPLISLYNYSDKSWVYEYKKITNIEQYSLGFVDIQNGKIYHDGASHVFCNELWTGDSIWTRKFNGNFLFGSCLYDNGTLYAAAEGDGYYALDAETGAIKWKGERAPGTSSRMVILNGVLYYINGGDGHLWALDAATGKTLWKLRSPDNDFGFKREINVMPGDGKRKGYVLTSTWHGACAYEAER